MKKTKVVCTMGPNTNDRELLKKLIENGMDVARFNFSHGDHEEQKSRMDLLKELREELNTNTAILLDTKGPAIIASILNFIIFFLSTRNLSRYSPKERARKAKFKQQSAPHMTYANGARHRCAVCGRTELDDPCLEFRFCSKCNGNYEYCQDHLFTHEHVK